MAISRIGTAATNTLFGMQFGVDPLIADIASIASAIANDQVNGNPVVPGAWANTGLLYIPNRGVLQCLPGDYVVVDGTTNWPILISKLSANGGDWVIT